MTAFSKKCAAFFGGFLLVTASGLSPAAAGFQWKGPLMPPPSAVAQESLAPVTEAPLAGGMTATEATMPAVRAEVVEAAAAPVSAPVTDDVLTGFGSDLPLAIALQQVLPAGYKVSFTKNVFPGTVVSWNGGKPWQDVLKDMIAPRDLTFAVKNDTVTIMPAPLPGAPANESSPDQSSPLPLTSGGADAPAAVNSSEQKPATVDIRRQKPSNILRKLGLTSSNEKNNSATEKPSDVAVPAADNNSAPESASNSSAPQSGAKACPLMGTPSCPMMMAEKSAAEKAMNSSEIQWTDGTSAADHAAMAPVLIAKASSSAPAPLSATPEPMWQGAKGQTLRAVLKEWSETAGVELYWAIDYDYRLTEDRIFGGSYDEAVAKLLDGFLTSRPQPYGQLHQSAEGPRVLVIKSYDLAG